MCPDPTRLTVRKVCDLFLDHSQRQNDAATYEWYRSYLQAFCDEYGRVNALKVKPIHVSRWLDAHTGWKSSRRCAVVSIKWAYNWAEGERTPRREPTQAPQEGTVEAASESSPLTSGRRF